MTATNELILAAGEVDWERLGPTYLNAISDTLFMVVITMIVSASSA